MFTWNKLDFWQSGEWDVVTERLQELDRLKVRYCPQRSLLTAALKAAKFEEVKVAIIGQDPYPNTVHATGIAFAIPSELTAVDFPPTLRNIFIELKEDQKVGYPISGDLSKWTDQGVLLWNVYPTCEAGKPASHRWPEYELLTQEIIRRLSEKYVVLCFLGSVAQKMLPFATGLNAVTFCTSHPSPRGSLNARVPFRGSRIFSTINLLLRNQGQEPINWKL